MAGFIYANQQTSTPTEAAPGFRPTMAGGGNGGIPFPAAPQDAHHFAIPEWGVRGWSFAQEDPHPLVRHVHGHGHTTCARGLPAQHLDKYEEKPMHFIPGISDSGPSHQVLPESNWSSRPTTASWPRPAPVTPAGGFIREAFQHQKDELKEKARHLLRLSGETRQR